jgi:hypothetical protein
VPAGLCVPRGFAGPRVGGGGGGGAKATQMKGLVSRDLKGHWDPCKGGPY